MKRTLCHFISFILFIVFFSASCTNEVIEPTSDLSVESRLNDKAGVRIVSQEEAINNLFEFLNAVDEPATKSGKERRISSIYTYVDGSLSTKSTYIPAAYIVNFENDEGAAVLGANTTVPPIVALMFNGNLDSNYLEQSSLPMDVTDYEGNPVDVNHFDFYSPEHDDYYVLGSGRSLTRDFVKEVIINGVSGNSNTSGNGGSKYATCEPLLNTQWDQGSWGIKTLYNSYCYKTTKSYGKKYVYTGCSTTALAAIVAYNAFPTNLYVLGKHIEYSEITNSINPIGLDSSYQDEIGRLMGAIFHNVNPMFVWSAGTCITPEEIKDCMSYLGYENVKKYSSNSFDSTFRQVTSDMLAQKRPVFVSAMNQTNLGDIISGSIEGHSWVIDGAYFNQNTWMLHCNWGWSGNCDGYFASNCFNPGDSNFTWHFRLITYSVPSADKTKTISFGL